MNVLVTTIIPTYSRNELLPRAILSALESSPSGASEVIVVPNGPNIDWKVVSERYPPGDRIRWDPIQTANANAARNHGMRLASGKFIRFLDDDDYLYPFACARQVEILESTHADVCSGSIDIAHSDGVVARTWIQPATEDIAVAAMTPLRMTAIHAHLYRRSSIGTTSWDESCAVRQDTDWFIRYATSRERKWARAENPVGAWVQHGGPRVSRGKDPGAAALKHTSRIIIEAMNLLESSNRLTPERRVAAADGLWASLQKGLMYDYAYWAGVAERAEHYAPMRRPPSLIHRTPVINIIPPLWIETLLIPARKLYRPARRILEQLGINRT